MQVSKKRSSTRKSRKPYKRRTRDGVTTAPRSIKLSSWDQPLRMTLKYSDAVVIATTVGTGFTTYTLRANSLFDPDYSGVGHQPLRFDQIAAMFNSYRVRASSLKVNFSVGDLGVSASALGPWRCTVTKSRNLTLPGTGTDYSTAAEMEGSQTGVLTTREQLTLYNNFNWRDIGVNNVEELNTGVTADPNSAFYWIISVFNEGNVAATNVLANFDIAFDCEFVSPKTIATS